MRRFYLTYQKYETVFHVSSSAQKSIYETLSRKSKSSGFPFKLTWSHYVHLMKIANEDERNFYEIEAIKENWWVRELLRQYNAAIYERLALSRNKRSVKQLAKKGQVISKPIDTIKSHYVLEFLDLQEGNYYTESDLESAIINKLEHFMMELGKGFLF